MGECLFARPRPSLNLISGKLRNMGTGIIQCVLLIYGSKLGFIGQVGETNPVHEYTHVHNKRTHTQRHTNSLLLWNMTSVITEDQKLIHLPGFFV